MNPNNRPDPLDEAFAALRRMTVPDRPPDADLLARLAAGPLPAAKPVSFFKRRNVMRLSVCSAAAAVLVAATTLILFNGSASIALADVIKAAEKHKLVKYKLTQADDMKDGGGVMPLVRIMYADLKAPRFRMEDHAIGSLSGAIDFEGVFVSDGKKNVCVHTITETVTEKGKTDPRLIEILKDFAKNGVPRKEVAISEAFGDFTPATAQINQSILENLRELEKHKDAVATKGKLGDKDVLKYRVEEEHKASILWVDAATKLPVKLEHEITDPKILHPTVTKMKLTLTDFEWDPELKDFKDLDQLFDTTPPKGYKVEDHRKKKDEKQDK
jgi:hypothetical protein